jgi:hypothetical protein
MICLPTDAPVFRTASPVTVNGQIGTRATLTCAVDALPVPSFRWYQNGYEVFENIETFTSLSRLRVKADSVITNSYLICLF